MFEVTNRVDLKSSHHRNNNFKYVRWWILTLQQSISNIHIYQIIMLYSKLYPSKTRKKSSWIMSLVTGVWSHFGGRILMKKMCWKEILEMYFPLLTNNENYSYRKWSQIQSIFTKLFYSDNILYYILRLNKIYQDINLRLLQNVSIYVCMFWECTNY